MLSESLFGTGRVNNFSVHEDRGSKPAGMQSAVAARAVVSRRHRLAECLGLAVCLKPERINHSDQFSSPNSRTIWSMHAQEQWNGYWGPVHTFITQLAFYCPRDRSRAKKTIEYVESVLLACISLACTSYKRSRLLKESSHRSQKNWDYWQGDGDGVEVLTCWECTSPAAAGRWSKLDRLHSG